MFAGFSYPSERKSPTLDRAEGREEQESHIPPQKKDKRQGGKKEDKRDHRYEIRQTEAIQHDIVTISKFKEFIQKNSLSLLIRFQMANPAPWKYAGGSPP